MSEPQIPAPVRWNWSSYLHETQRADAISRNMPALDEQINQAKRLLANLTAKQIEDENKRAEHLANAALSRQIVEDLCTRHGWPIPADDDVLQSDTTKFEIQRPALCVHCHHPLTMAAGNPPTWIHSSTGNARCADAGDDIAAPGRDVTGNGNTWPGLTPCEDDPPRCGDCTGDRCGHACHSQDAANRIDQTTGHYNTLPDHPAGGDRAEARFHPETNGG